MDRLKIIAAVTELIAYLAMSSFTVSAWCCLREQKRNIISIKEMQTRLFALTFAIKLQGEIDQVGRMEHTKDNFIKEEQYEEAQRLQEAIAKMQEHVRDSIRTYNELFGDFSELRNLVR